MQTEVLITARNKGDEIKFEGEITIAQKTFSYHLEFQVPLSQYMTAAQGKTVVQMRQLVPITLVSDGQEIQLTDEEWQVFYYSLVPSAIRIYNARLQIDQSVKPNRHAILKAGSKVILRPHTCRLLAQAKFGCKFLTEEIQTKGKPS